MAPGPLMPHSPDYCKDCRTRPPEPGRARCSECLAARRASEAKDRAERRQAGRCLRCEKKARKGRSYCGDHLAYYAARPQAPRRVNPAAPPGTVTVHVPIALIEAIVAADAVYHAANKKSGPASRDAELAYIATDVARGALATAVLAQVQGRDRT